MNGTIITRVADNESHAHFFWLALRCSEIVEGARLYWSNGFHSLGGMAIKMRLIRRFKESLLHKPVVLELSTLQEIELDVRTEIPCCRGFYINVGSKRIGIVATDEGPVLLCNQDKFLLKKDAFRFILQQNEEINTFTFMWKDGVKIQIPYVRSLIRSNGQWIDDYIFDFFAWLYEAAESHRFFAYYTVPGISITELFPDQTIHRVENKLLFA